MIQARTGQILMEHGPAGQAECGKHRTPAVDTLTLLRRMSQRRGIYSQPASQTEIHALHVMLGQHVTEPLAKADAACAVQSKRANSIWSFHAARGLNGGVGFLALNPLGLYKLIYGKLDLTDPDLDCISPHPERPAILYLWALVAQGSGIGGLSGILDFLETPALRRVDIWTRAVTPVGPSERALFKYDRSGP
jgi:hypothetical protein